MCIPPKEDVTDWAAELFDATKEIESLRAQVAELSDAFTVIWVSDDHTAWDDKAVEHFDALLAKVGGSDTASLGMKTIGSVMKTSIGEFSDEP